MSIEAGDLPQEIKVNHLSADTLNVLLIDPDLKIRRLLVSALEAFQANVVQSATLKEAELELAVLPPDLIVLDSVQADVDVVEWLEARRKDGLRSKTILLCSGGHSTNEFCRLFQDPLTIAVLHKPVSSGVIQGILEKSLQMKPAQKASEPSTPESEDESLDEIEREIRALSVEYIRELPGRLAFLQRQVFEIKSGTAEPGAAKSEAHKIKGTASSYGVHAVGEQAVIIDDCLKQIAKGENSPELWSRLEKSLDEACRQADLALAECDAKTMTPVLYDDARAMDNLLPAGQGQRIVIIDDDEDFTRRLSMMLGCEDMLVYSFNDAAKLNEVLALVQPDLLILDLNMPDMDGYEVCKRVRVDSRWRALPVIFITAQTGWETRVAAFDAGGDDYIPKPVVNQELISRIRIRVERARLQKELEAKNSINRLLWQCFLTILIDEKVAGPED